MAAQKAGVPVTLVDNSQASLDKGLKFAGKLERWLSKVEIEMKQISNTVLQKTSCLRRTFPRSASPRMPLLLRGPSSPRV